MEIKTKFSIGQTLWTVRDCKTLSFEVNGIFYDGNVTYYGKPNFYSIPESQCFLTQEELMEYITK